MTLLDFYIKSNTALRRLNDLDALIIEHVGLLSKLLDCQVSIVLRQSETVYGLPCSIQVLRNSHPLMAIFNWQNGLAYSISTGVIIFWSRSLSDAVLAANAVSQTDIAINNLVMRQELQELANTDGLTTLLTRRRFMECLQHELDMSKRYSRNLGMMIIDLDHFKSYNDSFGHPEGDILLKKTGRLLKRSVRATDIVGRCGGEEFGLASPDCSMAGLAIIAEKIRTNIESMTARRQVTCSIGGSIFPDDGKTIEALYQRADERLYKAKEGGRNRVILD